MIDKETATPEIASPPSEMLMDLSRNVEADIDYFIMMVHDELKAGSTPYKLLELFFPALEEYERDLIEKVESILPQTSKEVTELFRLRIKIMMMPEEVIWRAIASSNPENEEAQSMLLWIQRHLYGHFATGIDYILAGKADEEDFTPEEKGMLQEMTTGALLTKEPHKNAAVFVSNATYDRVGIDLQLLYIPSGLYKTENIQVKTSDKLSSNMIHYSHTTVVNGIDTGNITTQDDGSKTETWQTAYAIWHDVHSKEKTDSTESEQLRIKSLLKYNSGKNVIGWLNDLGKR